MIPVNDTPYNTSTETPIASLLDITMTLPNLTGKIASKVFEESGGECAV